MSDTLEIMTMKELTDYLRTSIPTVKQMIKEGLPFFTLNDHPDSHKRFKKSEVDVFVSQRSQGS